LTAEQRALTDNGSITQLSDCELYNLALLFDKDLLLKHGNPSFTIRIKTLDLAVMIKRIDALELQAPLWASWSGSYWHQENTYNCASIVLKILYEGGMRDKVHSHAFFYSIVGLFLGLVSLSFTHAPALVFCSLIIGCIGGRFLGGLMDGFEDIQPFLDLVASESRDDIGTVLGLRLAASLCVAFVSLFKAGPIFPDYLALPHHVEALTEEARHFDESRYQFTPPKKARLVAQ
jgi:hypothetical protein